MGKETKKCGKKPVRAMMGENNLIQHVNKDYRIQKKKTHLFAGEGSGTGGTHPCVVMPCHHASRLGHRNVWSRGAASLKHHEWWGFSSVKWTRSVLEAGSVRKGAQPDRVTKTWADHGCSS